MSKSIAISVFLALILFWWVIAYFFGADPNRVEPYGALWGILHGFIIVPTFILSLFSDAYVIYSPNHYSSWYDFWYLMGIFSIRTRT